MIRVIVDSATQARLHNLEAELELCDETGRTLGHFLPEEAYKKLLVRSVQIPFSAEEIERRRQETGGITLAEIWKKLASS